MNNRLEIKDNKVDKLFSPDNEMDLAFIKSLLEAEGIQYYVHNDHFGSLNVGPRIGLLNAKTIFVREEDSERAQEIISVYLEEHDQAEGNSKEKCNSAYTFKDRLRVVLETFLFWWFIPPGRRWRRKKQNDEKEESLTLRRPPSVKSKTDPGTK